MALEAFDHSEVAYNLHTAVVALQKIYVETGQEPTEEAVETFSEEDPRQYPPLWVYGKIFRGGLEEAKRIAGVDRKSIERRLARLASESIKQEPPLDEEPELDLADEEFEAEYEPAEASLH